MNKMGRNDLCPCGSGKKHKKCCLKEAQSHSFKAMGLPRLFTQDARASAIQKLMRFASRPEFDTYQDIGWSIFWEGFENLSEKEIQRVLDLPQTEINFNAWFLFDFDMNIKDGKTIADFFMVQAGDHLSSGERAYLEKALQYHFRLYEVERVELDEGFQLKDLWTGRSYWVRERAATHCCVQWDLIATRLMDEGEDEWMIDASAFSYPPQAKPSLLKALQEAYNQFQIDSPDQNDVVFFKRIGMLLFSDMWLYWAFPPPPRFSTPEGNPITFTKSVFKILDVNLLKEALEQHSDFEEIKQAEEYCWREEIPDGHRTLAALKIKNGRLILEALSEERAERGRELLERIAGSAIRYRITEYQDQAQILRAAQDRDPLKKTKVKRGIPDEIQAELKKTFMDRHYRKWLDEHIPALDHKTPKDAVTLKDYRSRVVDLLKGMENMEARAVQQGDVPYGFGWLWKELGLEREPIL